MRNIELADTVKAIDQIIKDHPKESGRLKYHRAVFRQRVGTMFSGDPATWSPQATEAHGQMMKALADFKPEARFFGAVEVSTDGVDSLKPKPVKIIAFSGKPAYQSYWGKCVASMEGFIPPSGSVPLDYAHDDAEVVGVADSVSVVDGQLVAAGRLIPFAPDDRASEIIAKAAMGVPYQASINLNPQSLKFHKLNEGETEIVNGVEFVGPGTVFDQWSIVGVAILPYGADASTSVQFSAGKPLPNTAADRGRDDMKKLAQDQLSKKQNGPKQQTSVGTGYSPAMRRFIASQAARMPGAKKK